MAGDSLFKLAFSGSLSHGEFFRCLCTYTDDNAEPSERFFYFAHKRGGHPRLIILARCLPFKRDGEDYLRIQTTQIIPEVKFVIPLAAVLPFFQEGMHVKGISACQVRRGRSETFRHNSGVRSGDIWTLPVSIRFGWARLGSARFDSVRFGSFRVGSFRFDSGRSVRIVSVRFGSVRFVSMMPISIRFCIQT